MAEARDNLAEAGEVDRRLRSEVYVTQVEIAVG